MIVLSIYLAELFPLVVRIRGLALCGLANKFGQCLAPFVIIGKGGPAWYAQYIVFVVLSGISICFVLLLPETSGFTDVFSIDYIANIS